MIQNSCEAFISSLQASLR